MGLLYPRRTPHGVHVPLTKKYLLDQVISSLSRDRLAVTYRGGSTVDIDEAIRAVRELYKYLG